MLLRPASLALAAALACAPAIASADPVPTVAVQHDTSTTAPAPTQAVTTSRGDAQRYAQREHQAPKAADYKGGSVYVIGISGTALVLIVLALLLL